MHDADAESLPQSILDAFPTVPDRLEYVRWEGKKDILYRLERREGKVRAVPCPPVRKTNSSEGGWTERRILDYD
jgi:hypothetical protein